MSGNDNISYTVTKVTAAAYTVTVNDSVLLCDPSGGAITITVPQAGAEWQSGRTLFIRTTGTTNSVTITPTTSTIDGGASLVLASGAVHGAVVMSDGTNYFSIVKS